MKKLMILLMILGISSCASLTEIPVESYEKIVYKDSLVYVHDTLTIEIPKEIIKEVVPQDTTSILSTSLATSEAKIQKGMLHHSLEQKGTLKTIIDTCYITQIKEVEKMVEVPIEVEVIKYKRDNIFWFSIIFNILVLVFIGLRIYLKLKG